MKTGEKIGEIAIQAKELWPEIKTSVEQSSMTAELLCKREQVPGVCSWLFEKQRYHFTGLVVEETDRWDLRYLFVGRGEMGLIQVRTQAPIGEIDFESVSVSVHAADWHEREAEDLFGLLFKGHPRLGDFILHDDAWQKGAAPMRNGFDFKGTLSTRKHDKDWRPRRVVDVPGAFVMPVGPVFSGVSESVHFQLETIGEEVLRVFPRLFFKYRGVEKSAEGRSIDEVLLLSERFAGTAAFAHSMAFCMAVEQLSNLVIPPRAQLLRVYFLELERIRSHLATIEAVCNSTGLVVAAGQTAILEEEALRLLGTIAGHRYLFGLQIPGGLSRDFHESSLRDTLSGVRQLVRRMAEVEKLLVNTSSFLDRIEQVGAISLAQALDYGLVGPVARGSGYCNDLREFWPYAKYDTLKFDTACETEGDGYARLRILFSEVRQSLRIMEQVVEYLPGGPVSISCDVAPGVALAGVETPRGAMLNWIRINEEGKVKRYRLITPSFTNWHGFHLAAENFAFQDFPIILATFGLSVAENDR